MKFVLRSLVSRSRQPLSHCGATWGPYPDLQRCLWPRAQTSSTVGFWWKWGRKAVHSKKTHTQTWGEHAGSTQKLPPPGANWTQVMVLTAARLCCRAEKTCCSFHVGKVIQGLWCRLTLFLYLFCQVQVTEVAPCSGPKPLPHTRCKCFIFFLVVL